MTATIPHMSWWVVAVLFLSVAAVVAALLYRRRSSADSSIALLAQQLTSMNEGLARQIGDIREQTTSRIRELQESVNNRLAESGQQIQATHKIVGERIDRNTAIFGQVQERLGRLEVVSQEIKTLGGEITQLQDILKAPKLRGNLGELFLEELLAQILPTHAFEMQYAFRGGEKVDAVIRLSQGHLVPIDAKFPLENFQRMIATSAPDESKRYRKDFTSDFRKHIDQIAAKYIRPNEGTLDFALLYVPAENVFYEAILRDEAEQNAASTGLNRYALDRRVIPVSPNSLYAYLQAIVLGLKGLQIEDKAREIMGYLSHLANELEKVHGEVELTGKHVKNALSAFEKSDRRLDRVRHQVSQLDSSERSPEVSQEETKPLTEGV